MCIYIKIYLIKKINQKEVDLSTQSHVLICIDNEL